MKRTLILIIFAVVLSGLCFMFIKDNSIEQIVDVLESHDGRLLVLQKESADSLTEGLLNNFQTSYKLLITNDKGHILRTVKLPEDPSGTFSEYGNLTSDGQGNFYVHRTQKNAVSYFVFYEEILKITPDGKTITPIYTIDYKSEGKVEYSLIKKIYTLGRSMYVIEKSPIDELTWSVSQINLFSMTTGKIKSIQMDPKLDVSDLISLSDGSIVIATIQGDLLQYVDGKSEPLVKTGMASQYLPAKLYPFDNNGFAFYDLLSAQVVAFSPASDTVTILRKSNAVISSTYQLTYKDANTLHINGERSLTGGMRVNAKGQRFLFLDRLNQQEVFSVYTYSWTDQAFQLLILLAGFGGVAFVFRMLLLAYEKSNGSLMIKIIAILLPLVLLIPIISLAVSFSYFSNLAKNDLFAELYHITTEKSKQIDFKAVQGINDLMDYKNVFFKQLEEERGIEANVFNEKALDTYERWYYSVVYRYTGDKIRVVAGDAASFWTSTDYIYGERGNDIYEQALSGTETLLGENSDLSGEWVFALTPIKDAEGKTVGLFEVGTGKQSYMYFIQSYYSKLVKLNLAAVGIVLLLVSLVIFRIILPLRQLNVTVADITAGNWGTTVDVRSHDEIGSLTAVFNKMSLFINDYIGELTKLNAIYFKFIPLKFFDLMDKKSIIEVGLGDYSKQEMTIAFINTFNYFDLSKGMGSKSQLDLLNKLFEGYANAIHQHNGLVGEFRNAGILAMFTEPKDALDASYAILQKIHESTMPIKTTISIHHGEVILGVVGDVNRMTTAVISDCVNEAVAIDKFAGKYNCSVLMTDAFIQTFEAGNEMPGKSRYIGELMDEHGENVLHIHEWLETVSVANQFSFIKTKERFSKALALYGEGQYDASKKDFIQVIRDNSADLVSKEYLYKCERALADESHFEKELGRF